MWTSSSPWDVLIGSTRTKTSFDNAHAFDGNQHRQKQSTQKQWLQ